MLSVGAFLGGRVWVGMAPKPCSAGSGVGPHATWPTGLIVQWSGLWYSGPLRLNLAVLVWGSGV